MHGDHGRPAWFVLSGGRRRASTCPTVTHHCVVFAPAWVVHTCRARPRCGGGWTAICHTSSVGLLDPRARGTSLDFCPTGGDGASATMRQRVSDGAPARSVRRRSGRQAVRRVSRRGGQRPHRPAAAAATIAAVAVPAGCWAGLSRWRSGTALLKVSWSPAAFGGGGAQPPVGVDRDRMPDLLEHGQVGGRVGVGVAGAQVVAARLGQFADRGRFLRGVDVAGDLAGVVAVGWTISVATT